MVYIHNDIHKSGPSRGARRREARAPVGLLKVALMIAVGAIARFGQGFT